LLFLFYEKTGTQFPNAFVLKRKKEKKKVQSFSEYTFQKNLIVHFFKSTFLFIMSDSKCIDKKAINYALGKVRKNSENILMC